MMVRASVNRVGNSSTIDMFLVSTLCFKSNKKIRFILVMV